VVHDEGSCRFRHEHQNFFIHRRLAGRDRQSVFPQALDVDANRILCQAASIRREKAKREIRNASAIDDEGSLSNDSKNNSVC
jgi:hypothetical protein